MSDATPAPGENIPVETLPNLRDIGGYGHASGQVVRHRHFTVNGRTVDIPSFQVKPGDEIQVREKSKEMLLFKSSLEARKGQGTPDWMELNTEKLSGRVLHVPTRASIGVPINEQLIVELYSK